MAKQFLSLIKFRRGTRAERQQVIFEEGEPLYETDSRRMYIGTGDVEDKEGDPRVSSSSIPVGNLSFAGAPDESSVEDDWKTTWYSDTAEENDALYHKGRIYFWKKSGEGFEWTEALHVDNNTLTFTESGSLHVNVENIVSVSGEKPINVTSSKNGEKITFTASLGINKNFFTTDASGNLIIKENSITNNLINWSSVNLLDSKVLDSRYFGTNSKGQATIINVPAGNVTDTVELDLDGKPIGSVNAIITDRFDKSPDFVLDDNKNIRVSAEIGVNIGDFFGVADKGDINSGYNGAVIALTDEEEAPRTEVTVYKCSQYNMSDTPTNTLKSAGFIKIPGGTITKQDGSTITYPDLAVPSFTVEDYQASEKEDEYNYDTSEITENTSIITSILPSEPIGYASDYKSPYGCYLAASDNPGPIQVSGINLIKDVTGGPYLDDDSPGWQTRKVIQSISSEIWNVYLQNRDNFDVSDYALTFTAAESDEAQPASIVIPYIRLTSIGTGSAQLASKIHVVYGYNSAGQPLTFSHTISTSTNLSNYVSNLLSVAGNYLTATYFQNSTDTSNQWIFIKTKAKGYAAGKGLYVYCTDVNGAVINSTFSPFTPGTDAITVGQKFTYHPVIPNITYDDKHKWSPWAGYPTFNARLIASNFTPPESAEAHGSVIISGETFSYNITIARPNGKRVLNVSGNAVKKEDLVDTLRNVINEKFRKYRMVCVLELLGNTLALDLSSNTYMPEPLNGTVVTVTVCNEEGLDMQIRCTMTGGVDGYITDSGKKIDMYSFLNEKVMYGSIFFADDRDTDVTRYSNTSLPVVPGTWSLTKGPNLIAKMQVDKKFKKASLDYINDYIYSSSTPWVGDYAQYQKPFLYSAIFYGDEVQFRFTGLFTANDYAKKDGWGTYTKIFSNKAFPKSGTLQPTFWIMPHLAGDNLGWKDLSSPVVSVKAAALDISSLVDFDTRWFTITNAETKIFTADNGVRTCKFVIK